MAELLADLLYLASPRFVISHRFKEARRFLFSVNLWASLNLWEKTQFTKSDDVQYNVCGGSKPDHEGLDEVFGLGDAELGRGFEAEAGAIAPKELEDNG